QLFVLMLFVCFSATAPTDTYTLSLHDALPILRVTRKISTDLPQINDAVAEAQVRLGSSGRIVLRASGTEPVIRVMVEGRDEHLVDRKSTRLNSSHVKISYAVFCLKKKTR